MSNFTKTFQEDFAKFFEAPSREGLRNLLQSQVGELDSFDFKQQWPSHPKISRHILGLANSGGGCLIIGVEEKDDKTFQPVGIKSFHDKSEIQKGVRKYIPAQLKYLVLDFAYEDSEYPKLVGKKFQVLLVEDIPEYIPFIAKSNGDGIRRNSIYIRRGTNTEEANYEALQEVVNRRIETGYSSKGEFDLNRHLSELNALYAHIEPARDPYEGFEYFDNLPLHYETNPLYPKESYEQFVSRMIREKKRLIEKTLVEKSRL